MLAMSGSAAAAGRSTLCKNAVASCSYISSHRASTLATRKREPLAPRQKKTGAGEEPERPSSTLIGRLMSLQGWGGRRGRGKGPPPSAVLVNPLKPHEVARRVTQLINEDRLEYAIEMVNNLPRQAQDVVVWNLLIAEAMTKQRFTRGFEIYYDMKRRQVAPTTRTFLTVLVGVTKIQRWTKNTALLKRVHVVYQQCLAHLKNLRHKDPHHPDLIPWPINAYIKVLGDAEMWSQVFDVFWSMKDYSPPDETTYTIMLQLLRNRKSLMNQFCKVDSSLDEEIAQWEDAHDVAEGEQLASARPKEGVPDSGNAEIVEDDVPNEKQVDKRNAQDARTIWDTLTKCASATGNIGSKVCVNEHHVESMLRLMARGGPEEQRFGFNIVRTFMPQLRLSGEKKAKDIPPNAVMINKYTLDAVLELCSLSGKPGAAIEFFRIVTDPSKKSGLWKVLDKNHMRYVFKAYADVISSHGVLSDGREAVAVLEWMIRCVKEKGQTQLIPVMRHCMYVLTAAANGGDVSSALRVYELMTGHQREEFTDGAPPPNRRPDCSVLGPEVKLRWNYYCMDQLIKAASVARSVQYMRVALRILAYYPPDAFLGYAPPNLEPRQGLATRKELVIRVLRGCQDVFGRSGGSWNAEMTKWTAIERRATEEKEEIERLEAALDKEEENSKAEEDAPSQESLVQRLVWVEGAKKDWNAESQTI